MSFVNDTALSQDRKHPALHVMCVCLPALVGVCRCGVGVCLHLYTSNQAMKENGSCFLDFQVSEIDVYKTKSTKSFVYFFYISNV